MPARRPAAPNPVSAETREIVGCALLSLGLLVSCEPIEVLEPRDAAPDTGTCERGVEPGSEWRWSAGPAGGAARASSTYEGLRYAIPLGWVEAVVERSASGARLLALPDGEVATSVAASADGVFVTSRDRPTTAGQAPGDRVYMLRGGALGLAMDGLPTGALISEVRAEGDRVTLVGEAALYARGSGGTWSALTTGAPPAPIRALLHSESGVHRVQTESGLARYSMAEGWTTAPTPPMELDTFSRGPRTIGTRRSSSLALEWSPSEDRWQTLPTPPTVLDRVFVTSAGAVLGLGLEGRQPHLLQLAASGESWDSVALGGGAAITDEQQRHYRAYPGCVSQRFGCADAPDGLLDESDGALRLTFAGQSHTLVDGVWQSERSEMPASVTALFSRGGSTWAATESGELFTLDAERWAPFAHVGAEVTAMVDDTRGSLWVASRTAGVFEVLADGGVVSRSEGLALDASGALSYGALTRYDGDVVVAGIGGVYRWRDSGSFAPFNEGLPALTRAGGPHRPSGLSLLAHGGTLLLGTGQDGAWHLGEQGWRPVEGSPGSVSAMMPQGESAMAWGGELATFGGRALEAVVVGAIEAGPAASRGWSERARHTLEPLPSPFSIRVDGHVFGVASVGARHWAAYGRNVSEGHMLRSDDGGRTWTLDAAGLPEREWPFDAQTPLTFANGLTRAETALVLASRAGVYTRSLTCR